MILRGLQQGIRPNICRGKIHSCDIMRGHHSGSVNGDNAASPRIKNRKYAETFPQTIPSGDLIEGNLLIQSVVFMFWLMTDSISRFSDRFAGYSALLKSSQYFSQRSFWSTPRSASAPAAVASLWSDNSREGNTKPSQSAGAVRGDRHCPLRKWVIRNLKSYDFNRAGYSSSFSPVSCEKMARK